MAGNLTEHAHKRALIAGIGGAITAAAATYIALATAEAASPGTATLAQFAANEITTTGYQRQAISWGTATTTSGTTTIPNANILTYTFEDDPPEVTHIFECDTSIGTSGTVLAYWDLTSGLNAATDDHILFPAGSITMSVA